MRPVIQDKPFHFVSGRFEVIEQGADHRPQYSFYVDNKLMTAAITCCLSIS